MPLVSSLGANLVPDSVQHARPAMTGGKYKSSLSADLMPTEHKPPPAYKEPAAPSNLGVGGLLPRSTQPAAPPPAAAAASAPRKFEDRAKLPPPEAPPAAPPPPPREPRRCMYTGDDLPPEPRRAAQAHPIGAPVTGERYQRWLGAQHREGSATRQSVAQGEGLCVFNQETLPPHASEPETLRRLRELKTRTVMPETLGQHGGFAPIAANAPDPDVAAAWANELEQRQWAHEQHGLAKQRRKEEVAREINNRAVSAYGEKLPARGRGDVFPPWAPRQF